MKLKSKKEIQEWLSEMGVKNYTINSDLTVDVDSDVNLLSLKLSYLPVQFGVVSGYFYCDYNQLTSLKGCPKEVGGHFSCGYNELTSLAGCPKEVGGYFSCEYNELTSLEGCPKKVSGDFYCWYNKTIFTRQDVQSLCKVDSIVV